MSANEPHALQPAMDLLAAGQLRAAILAGEPLYRRDPQGAAGAAFAAALLTRVATEVSHTKQATALEGYGALRQMRLDLVTTLIALEPGAFPTSWGLLGGAYEALLKSGLRCLARLPVEEDIFSRLHGLLGASAVQLPHGILLAAMLVARNFELPLIDPPARIPDWLRPVYLAMLLESPPVFNHIGEAERYVDHFSELTALVHRLACRPEKAEWSPATADLIAQYAMKTNLCQVYFSDRNLRQIYQRRGEILSAYLLSQGMPALAGSLPDSAPSGRKIRLGIFAESLEPRTETYFTLSHFEFLDRERFDITLYTVRSNGNRLERYCASRADRLITLHPDDVAQQIARIRADTLDMLLISTNMTVVTNFASILGAARLAPIQIASVCSPVTTGANHVDVMLSAAWNEPAADARDHYTEYLLRMPESVNYYAYQHDHDPVTVKISRERLGIPPGKLVFFSGANFYKILPELSAQWAQILAAVPDSLLLLMPFNPHWSSTYERLPFMARIRHQLLAAGVAPQRLHIIDTVPTRADVHQVMRLADLYLDGYPFAGACSMLDSIIVGMPAIVRGGVAGRSNHGVSLMHMVGLGELCSFSPEDYVAKAIALAGDPGRRDAIRAHLSQLATAVPPVYYDTAVFSGRVGHALVELYNARVRRYGRLAGAAAELRRTLVESARQVIGRRPELDALTDIGIVELVIAPYFNSHGTTQRRLMLDVGACHGAMAAPLLARGWRAELFEPDPAARRVLEKNLGPYRAQTRIHAMAAGPQTAATVAFHQAGTQGLSGFDESPFGSTANVLQVPCITLSDFCARHALTRVDFLKIDAEGYDFDVLESLDFDRVRPELILVEYGLHFPRQTLAVVNECIAKMASHSYGAVVFAYTDDGNFKRLRWVYRLTDLYLDGDMPAQPPGAFGNILFYPAQDTRLCLILQALIDSCSPPRELWEGML